MKSWGKWFLLWIKKFWKGIKFEVRECKPEREVEEKGVRKSGKKKRVRNVITFPDQNVSSKKDEGIKLRKSSNGKNVGA